MEAESQTSNASNEFDSSSVSAPIGAFPGPRSVFEDSFDLDDGRVPHFVPHPSPDPIFNLDIAIFAPDSLPIPSLAPALVSGSRLLMLQILPV